MCCFEMVPSEPEQVLNGTMQGLLQRHTQPPTYVWTTFSDDQIDLNFRNPAVLLRVIDGLLLYVRNGADILRLDAGVSSACRQLHQPMDRVVSGLPTPFQEYADVPTGHGCAQSHGQVEPHQCSVLHSQHTPYG